MKSLLLAFAFLVAAAGGIAVVSSAMADDGQGKCQSNDCK